MRRDVIVCALSVVGVVAVIVGTTPAQQAAIQQEFVADRVMAPAPIPSRVANAEVIVVGKVAQLEPKSVTATRFPGAKDKVDYAIAVVEVADGVQGAKDMKKVRVGFVPPPPPNPGAPQIGGGRFPQLNHQVGQEGLYFLRKHHDGDFYVAQSYTDVIEKKAANFDKELEQAKKSAKLLADPNAGLKSKEADERFQTAAMLITRYRTPSRTGASQAVAIDAAQSKLILEALAGADWTKRDFNQLSPLASFYQLAVTEKDGWKQPQKPLEVGAAAQKWCQDNAAKYVIQKFVPAK